jgi:hypothetical protein
MGIASPLEGAAPLKPKPDLSGPPARFTLLPFLFEPRLRRHG